MLFMVKVLWAVMYINMHLPSRLEGQQRGLNWNTPFILDNLTGYHHPGDMLIKVLSWFCLERDRGRPSTRVTEIRESSNIASIRKTEVLFKMSTGAAFWNSWSPDLPCLSGLLLMTLSWVVSRVLAPGKAPTCQLAWQLLTPCWMRTCTPSLIQWKFIKCLLISNPGDTIVRVTLERWSSSWDA